MTRFIQHVFALWWLCSFLSCMVTVDASSAKVTDFATSGVCLSVDIRTSPDNFRALEGCRVVEGFVQILLMDQYDKEDFENISFPLLVEITDYLMIYRINGIQTLHQLFPNLAVIRGQRLFKNYALVIYEMLMLQEIGLTSLQLIERGSVRIEKNDYLCGADKIDWTLICNNTSQDEHYIASNKGKEYCPICPNNCPSPKQQTKKLCWNMQDCQVDCSEGKCCAPHCAACHPEHRSNCTVCRHLSLGNSNDRQCVDKCPMGTFQHAKRRCITDVECRNLNNVRNVSQEARTQNYVPFEGHCHLGCPQGFKEVKNKDGAIECTTCDGKCLKHCPAKSIDSISAAQSLAGCAIIDGSLEIQIRSQGGRGTNIIRELEQSLSSIEEITGYLKIARSFPVVSLSFLKNLKRIRGMVLDSKKYSLVVLDNQNLQELWDANHQVVIERGKLSFNYNPKLCFFKIEQLDAASGKDVQIDNIETTRLSNGDKTACNVTVLNVTVNFVLTNAALLEWDPLTIDDERSLLGYVVSYITAPYSNVTLYDGRDACGTDGWHVDDVTDFVPNSRVSFPLTRLEPYTQYAFYVKTYTISTEKRGAQSPIGYFQTAPGRPDKVKKFKVVANSSSEIIVTWERPRKANGNLTHYVLKARLIDSGINGVEQRNYCDEPLIKHLDDHVTSTGGAAIVQEPSIEPPKEKCDCDVCTSPKKIADLTDAESAIDFEDDLQDHVYIRYNQGSDATTRSRRHLPDDHDHGSLLSTRYRRNEQNPTPKPDSEEQLFPEPARSTPSAASELKPRTESTLSLKKDDYYTYIYEVVKATGNLQQFVLRDLRHFSYYSVSVRACRSGEGEDNCSSDQAHSEKTKEKKGVDNIIKSHVQLEASNSTLGSIKVSWASPSSPNGFIVSYTIKWQRVDLEHSVPIKICITHKHYVAFNGSILIPNLATGNYSLEIMATSIAGDGQYTPKKYLYIEETKSYMPYYIIVAMFAFFAISLSLFIWKCRKLYMPNISSMKLIAQVNPDYAGVQYKVDDWEVERSQICQYQELGQGSFGMVYSGTIRRDLSLEPCQCAIKTVNENATDKERASFLNEASVMKQFDTHHVVHLLGVVSKGQPTLVVMELMANGDLKGYLRSHRADYDAGTEPTPQPPTLRRILQIAAEIADGMAYLSAKKFVHRDLAARNCMVAEDLTVKIGDFGMTRDIYETDYYRKGTKGLLPVRWMSPESLKDGVFTSHSDVFSYGVVLWEMATLASQPYQGLSNDQVLRYVIDGGVMERPENCPDKMYEMMRRCWQHRPSARPHFLDIISKLLDDIEPNFKNVSFYHTTEAQDLYNAMTTNHVMDDVTTPLRRGDDMDDDLDDLEDNSSLDGRYNSLEGANSDHIDQLVPMEQNRPHLRPTQH